MSATISVYSGPLLPFRGSSSEMNRNRTVISPMGACPCVLSRPGKGRDCLFLREAVSMSTEGNRPGGGCKPVEAERPAKCPQSK